MAKPEIGWTEARDLTDPPPRLRIRLDEYGPLDMARSAGVGSWSWSNQYQVGMVFVRSRGNGQRGYRRVVKVGRLPCRTRLLLARSDLISSS